MFLPQPVMKNVAVSLMDYMRFQEACSGESDC
jgi:hypothetical protein